MMVKNVEMNIQQSSAQSATPAADILMTFSIQLRLSGFREDSLLSLCDIGGAVVIYHINVLTSEK